MNRLLFLEPSANQWNTQPQQPVSDPEYQPPDPAPTPYPDPTRPEPQEPTEPEVPPPDPPPDPDRPIPRASRMWVENMPRDSSSTIPPIFSCLE
jgi:hypothetical protein